MIVRRPQANQSLYSPTPTDSYVKRRHSMRLWVQLRPTIREGYRIELPFDEERRSPVTVLHCDALLNLVAEYTNLENKRRSHIGLEGAISHDTEDVDRAALRLRLLVVPSSSSDIVELHYHGQSSQESRHILNRLVASYLQKADQLSYRCPNLPSRSLLQQLSRLCDDSISVCRQV